MSEKLEMVCWMCIELAQGCTADGSWSRDAVLRLHDCLIARGISGHDFLDWGNRKALESEALRSEAWRALGGEQGEDTFSDMKLGLLLQGRERWTRLLQTAARGLSGQDWWRFYHDGCAIRDWFPIDEGA